jgi:multidrug efflux pump subunit AcrB
MGFLIGLVVTFFLSMSMFYTTSVPVKMLPLVNKSEFSISLDMPDGRALANTASTLHKMAQILRKIPEVVSIQTYAGTARVALSGPYTSATTGRNTGGPGGISTTA